MNQVHIILINLVEQISNRYSEDTYLPVDLTDAREELIVYINCYTIVKSIHYIMDDVVIHFWIHRVAEFQLTTPNDDVTLLAQFTKSRISVWSRRVFLALKKLQLQYKVRLLMLNETSKMKDWIWKYIY